MAESVVLPLLTEVAKPMVKVVMGRVTEEMRCIVGFRRELAGVQKKIRIIQGIVDSMTAVPNAAVEDWLRDAVRVMRSAEDMMDLLAYEKHRSDVMKRRRRNMNMKRLRLRLVLWPLKRVYLRTKIGSWIRKINTDIEDVRKEARFINELRGLERSASTLAATNTSIIDDQHHPLQQVRRHPDTSYFVGRDSDVAAVVHLLTNHPHLSHHHFTNNRLSVVAIVGIGGMGKTTLAKNIIENNLVLSHFNERIWISDLKSFNIKRILNEMVEILEMSNCEDINEVAVRKLEKCLGGKRYLLVLDDVWDISQDLWASLRNTLESIGGSKDSMVLTTTRSDVVALTMGAYPVHLSGLYEDESWSLFEQIAFANRSKEEVFALKPTGQKIVEKCKGVPLAIKSIAGMLHKKRNLYEWTTIEESELWVIQHHENAVLPSLMLSYNHLSPMLKKCFSICAFVPKDCWFVKYELICRWMALGLIQYLGDETKTMEDIGEDYIYELLSISFLLVRERNEYGEATSYELHDLVYDLARSVAMHERLYLEASKKENKAVDIQHLTIVEHTEKNHPDEEVLKNIRSLDLSNNLPVGLLEQVKYLRVLYIGHSAIEVVPESIGTLRCLRFLDLEKNPIKVLPDDIMKLYNLQSLFLYGCKSLFELPRGLSNLVNLRHLGVSFYFRPIEQGVIGQLKQLQTAPPLQLSEGGFQISELGSLQHLKGTLDVKGLELIKSKSDAEKSKLSMKPRVDQLRLSWDYNDDDFIKHEEVLSGLHPSPNLKLLSINGYGGDKFPSWLMRMNVLEDHNNGNAGSLCYLNKIELLNCRRCQQLPMLGHLPSLKIIEIRNMEKLKQIGPEFYGGSHDLLLENSKNQASSSSSSFDGKSMVDFASLKELRLKGLGELEEWWEPGTGKWTGFPCMEVLVFEKCPCLRKAPIKFPNLRELVVSEMTSSQPLRNIMSNKSNLSFLKKLEIQSVEELTNIPEEVGECTSLQTLVIEDCPMLTGLPDSLSELLSLEVLKIGWCPNLTSVPNLSCLGCLRELSLFINDGLVDAPEGLQSCKSLETLGIICCGKVETLPDLAGLSRLSELNIRGMTKLISSQPPD